VFAFRAFKPELLACNETIKKRTGTLISNLARCKVENSAVWSADPAVYAKRAPEAFDLVIVDAPCSGQSLMAKGDQAPGAFTPHIIDMCVGRQRRITGM
jgi:16S rRNA C967 or C1407 C5-methylase (RsmB/RsmF family)